VSKNKHKNHQRNSGSQQVAPARLTRVHTTCWMQSPDRAALGVSCSSCCCSATAAANVTLLHPSSSEAEPELLQFSPEASRKLFAILLMRSCQVHAVPAAVPHSPDKGHSPPPAWLHPPEFPASGSDQEKGGKFTRADEENCQSSSIKEAEKFAIT